MVLFLVIPIIVVTITGIAGYLLYRFVINDFLCNRTVNATLKEFKIKKTQYEIIKEYHDYKGEKISEKEIVHLQKHYRQHEPDQFLTMYDSIRDKSDNTKKN